MDPSNSRKLEMSVINLPSSASLKFENKKKILLIGLEVMLVHVLTLLKIQKNIKL